MFLPGSFLWKCFGGCSNNPFISIILTTCFLKAVEITCSKSCLPSSPPTTCSVLQNLGSVFAFWLCPEQLGKILELVLAGILLCWRCWLGRWAALGDSDKLGYNNSCGDPFLKTGLCGKSGDALMPGCMCALEILAPAGGVLVWQCGKQGTFLAVLLWNKMM